MQKSKTISAWVAATVALGALTQHAQSANFIGTGNLYQDSTTFQNANFNNGDSTEGNEVVLAGTSSSYEITSFSFQYDFVNTAGGTMAGTGEMADVTFYANNGPAVNGYNSPGTVLFNSGFFALGALTPGSTENFYQANLVGTGAGLVPGGGVDVPKDFTWTVTFEGLGANENAGLALYSPATVGANYNDAWVSNSPSGFALDVTSAGLPPLDFGAVFNGVGVPDSSCLPVSVVSVLAGFGWMKRLQRRKK